MKTQIIKTPEELKKIRSQHKNKTIGFVPTMGALHNGHTELLKKAIYENDISICSIFVNPTQFNNAEDLKKYPKTFESDYDILNQNAVDYLFYPNFESMYPDEYSYKISELNFSKTLCGKYREGHFDGVLTVVMKLFNLVEPTRAYFGEKDFQQLTLIKNMVQAFFMNVEIIPVKTVRDSEGLALSSRNSRLTNEGIQKAQFFAKILKNSKSIDDAKHELESLKIEVEYLEEINKRKFAAVWIDGVRLIDNV